MPNSKHALPHWATTLPHNGLHGLSMARLPVIKSAQAIFGPPGICKWECLQLPKYHQKVWFCIPL